MGTFRQLLSLTLDHAFFAPRPCRALRWRASAASIEQLRGAGCMLRELAAGFELCHDQGAAAALQLQCAQPWQLDFFACSTDPQFANYTELPSTRAPLCFADWSEVTAGGRAYRELHAAAAAAPAEPSRAAPPVCIVTLEIDADILARAPLAYRLSLPARATRWKYYFTGDWPAQPLRIVDAAGQLQFDAVQEERLGDGRRAQAILSSTAIALHERPQQRLALRAAHGGSEKLLIKRLPLASPARLRREALAGVPSWIAEIYVGA